MEVFMLPVECVIDESGITAARGRARLAIRLPWYRSLPLSTVRVERLAIDGADIPLESVRFSLNELNVTLEELEDCTDDFWFVLDSAYLEFPASVEPGSPHEVAVTVSLFPPYIPGMKRANAQSAKLIAGEAP